MKTDEHAASTAEAIARRSYGKLVALLAAGTRDLAGAEDLLSHAFESALATWPERGIPDHPEAWLLTVARRKRIDVARRERTGAANRAVLSMIFEELADDTASDAAIPDRRLQLMFACAHPAIDPAARAPLILQTVLGLDAATIAGAFLVAPAAMSQRLVRAKTKIREAGIPFRIPDAAEMPERLDAVLEAIYATFAEGWADAAGGDDHLGNLADEGLWLGQLVATLLPGEPEALGLAALMLFANARRPARRDAAGEFVPLLEQDTRLWDLDAIDEAERLLRRAGGLNRIGRYQLEAAIQSAHAARRTSGQADWPAIATLYDVLHRLTGSPVVAINRAVAIAEIDGPAAGLQALDAIAAAPQVAAYQPYWAAKAALLARAGANHDAATAYDRAIALQNDEAARRHLRRQRDALPGRRPN